MRAPLLALIALSLAALPGRAQDITLEYKVKAAYLYNFVKFVEWPESPEGREPSGPLTVCVAGRNPFGTLLDDVVRGEAIDGRPIVTRVILEPEPACNVVFVPKGSATTAYLRAARGQPVLTVGETDEFRKLGGIITFVRDTENVRFAINVHAADANRLRISSRLLRLAMVTRER